MISTYTLYIEHPNTDRLREEIAYALLEACLVVVMLLPSDKRQRVQNLHDDLKKIGRSNLVIDD